MNREITIILAVLYWAALFAIALPALISADSTIAVGIGITLFIASAYTTYRLVRRTFFTATNDKKESSP